MSSKKVDPADQSAAQLAERATRIEGGALIGGPPRFTLQIVVNGAPHTVEVGCVGFFTDEALGRLSQVVANVTGAVIQQVVPRIVDEIVRARLLEAGLTDEKLTSHETIVA